MPPKQIDREHAAQVSVKKSSRNKRSLSGSYIGIGKESKRRKADMASAEIGVTQSNTRLSKRWTIALNRDSSDSKDPESFNESISSSSNVTLRKLNTPRVLTKKTNSKLGTLKLSNNHTVNTVTPYASDKSPKLSLTTLSPAMLSQAKKSDSQTDSIFNSSKKKRLQLNIIDADTNLDCDMLNNDELSVPAKTKNKSTTSIGIRYSLRKLSKTPKIVSGSPNSKSQKKPRKSKSVRTNTEMTIVNSIPLINDKTVSQQRENNDTLTHREPIVLLEKLPGIVTVVSSSSSKSIQRRSLSPLKETVKARGKKVRSNSGKKEKKVHILQESASPGTLLSSTPKNRQKDSKTADQFEMGKVSYEQYSTPELRDCNIFASGEDTIKNVQEEAQEEEKGKNDTYELIEPKTPKLWKRLQQERAADGTGNKAEKKNVKVRFKSPSLNTSYTLRRRSQTSEKKQRHDFANITPNSSAKKNSSKFGDSSTAIRTSSCNSEAIPTVNSFTPSKRIRLQINSSSKINSSAISPFAVPTRKADTKPAITPKKVPNFAEIHKKMFARSESVVDAKKRVQNRHTALTTIKLLDSARTKVHLKDESKPTSVPSKDTYNRFGFKIRKHEATECILRKGNLHVTRAKQQNRSILKGVRTNRRFELQMKARNIK